MKNIMAFVICLFYLLVSGYANLYCEKVQWADTVINFSSQYSDKLGAAKQILGEPNTMVDFGSSFCSWIPQKHNIRNIEFITVGFKEAQKISQVAVCQNYISGLINKIILLDSSNLEHVVYEKKMNLPVNNGEVLNAFFDLTAYDVASLKLVLDLSKSDESPQIDAIAISDSPDSIKPAINVAKGAKLIGSAEVLDSNINTYASELAPIISQDGGTLYFVRESYQGNFGDGNNQDIWYSTLDSNGNFKKAVNIGLPLNNFMNNFVVSASADGNSLLLGNIYLHDGTTKRGLSKSKIDENGKWSFPGPVSVKNLYNYSKSIGYSLAPNGKELLISTEMDDSYGGNDLYVSFRINDTTWAEPINLGENINTASNEISPFLASDNVTLYFSSGGFPGYGNNDMFMTKRLDDSWTKWSKPENLGPAINSKTWDAYYSVPASGNWAYYSSYNGEKNLEDIFRVLLPNLMKPEAVALIYGKVIDSKTNKPIEAQIIYELLPSGKEAGVAHSNPVTGEYKIVLPNGYKYGFLAKVDNYISINENLDLRKLDDYSEVNKDLYLVPIEKGQTVRLNNIFFDTGKYDLLDDSFAELNRVVELMNKNIDLKLEISGHTDNVGKDEDNLVLSQKRAEAVANYLISKGIDKARLSEIGCGRAIPIVPNNSEQNRQKNRRVEFKIQ